MCVNLLLERKVGGRSLQAVKEHRRCPGHKRLVESFLAEIEADARAVGQVVPEDQENNTDYVLEILDYLDSGDTLPVDFRTRGDGSNTFDCLVLSRLEMQKHVFFKPCFLCKKKVFFLSKNSFLMFFFLFFFFLNYRKIFN